MPMISTNSPLHYHVARDTTAKGAGPGDWRAQAAPEDLIVEGWSQGLMVGGLLVMGCVTVANMRKGVKLHKLILAEQILAIWHGTFCFMDFSGYGWYLSTTAALLYISYVLHNFIAWLKIRPFYCQPNGIIDIRRGRYVKWIYLGTLSASIPVMIFDLVCNYMYFNDINTLFMDIRPYQALYRDPWWIFSCLTFFFVMRKGYDTRTLHLIRASPRFGVMMTAMTLSLIITPLDIVTTATNFLGKTSGINPWWKISLVMKCLTDAILLDDFKTEVRRLEIRRIKAAERRRDSVALVLDDPTPAEDTDPQQSSSSGRTPIRFWLPQRHDSTTFQTNALCPAQLDLESSGLDDRTAVPPCHADLTLATGPYHASNNDIRADIPSNAHMYATVTSRKQARRRSQYSVSSDSDSAYDFGPEERPRITLHRPSLEPRKITASGPSRTPSYRLFSRSQPASANNSRPHSYMSRAHSLLVEGQIHAPTPPSQAHIPNSEQPSRPSTPSSKLRNLRNQLPRHRKQPGHEFDSEKWEAASDSVVSMIEEPRREKKIEEQFKTSAVQPGKENEHEYEYEDEKEQQKEKQRDPNG